MDKLVSLAKGVNKEIIEDLIARVENNAYQVEDIIEKSIKSYCSELDTLMDKIKEIVFDKNSTITDEELDYLVMQLPCVMYFMANAQEGLGLREDVSKALEKELYNKTLTETTGTVSEKESLAALASQQQALITVMNSRAYKKLKTRMDLALETLGSLKKVIQRRISARELSLRDRG